MSPFPVSSASKHALILAGLVATSACSSASDAGSSPANSGAHGDRVFATLLGESAVIEIDAETRKIERTIPVGDSPAILLGTPDHAKLFSADWGDNTVSAIDVTTSKVKSIPTDGRPWVITVSPDGSVVYVGLGSNQIAVIGTESESIERTIPFDTLPASIIVSPDSKVLYVADLTGNAIRAIDAESGSVVRDAIPVGTAPAWITITPDGSTVYTLNFLSDDISVVDTASWAVTATIPTGQGSAGIIGNVDPSGSILGVTDFGAMDVAGIDTKSNEVAWKIPTTGRPVGLGFSPDGKLGYAGDYGPESASFTPADLINSLVTLAPLPVTGNGAITVFDPKTGKTVGAPIAVGKGPSSIVVMP